MVDFNDAESPSAPPFALPNQIASVGAPPEFHSKLLDLEPGLERNTTWLNDGNIVVQVEGTQFKLFKSVLSSKSAYFANLFQDEEHETTRSHYIRVTNGNTSTDFADITHMGVAAEDFEILLGIEEDIWNYIRTSPPFRTVAAVLRAATPLGFAKLRKWAICHVELMWNRDIEVPLPNGLVDYKADAVLAIALGRKFDVPNILKRAFYELARGENLGEMHRPGSLLSDPFHDPFASLASNDLRLLTKLREKMAIAWLTYSHFVKKTTCSGEKDCNKGISEWVIKKINSDEYKIYLHDPIEGLSAFGVMTLGFQCKNCRESKTPQKLWLKNRDELWASVSGWLEL